jgi:hypothetical protein
VVGAQNAGKSSLISAMKRLGGTSGKREISCRHIGTFVFRLLRVMICNNRADLVALQRRVPTLPPSPSVPKQASPPLRLCQGLLSA